MKRLMFSLVLLLCVAATPGGGDGGWINVPGGMGVFVAQNEDHEKAVATTFVHKGEPYLLVLTRAGQFPPEWESNSTIVFAKAPFPPLTSPFGSFTSTITDDDGNEHEVETEIIQGGESGWRDTLEEHLDKHEAMKAALISRGLLTPETP